MGASLIRGNALRLPLRDRSVHLALSSPPYHALRAYQDGGEHYDGQLGSEANPWLYLSNLWAVMDEVWRVLRDDGSAFVNLGDRFAGSGGHNNSALSAASSTLDGRRQSRSGTGGAMPWEPPPKASRRNAPDRYNQHTGGLRPKTRMGLPHRFYEGCVDPDYRQWTEQRAGLPPTERAPQWVGRMDIVWLKPSALPESVTDRVRASHEYVFHLTKNERYYAAIDSIREEHTWDREVDPKWAEAREATAAIRGSGHRNGLSGGFTHPPNPLGKLPGSVWEIASEPLIVPPEIGVDHFASWPSSLAKRIVLGWSPLGVCTACGEGRRPVSEKTYRTDHFVSKDRRSAALRASGEQLSGPGRDASERAYGIARLESTIVGYACACPDATAPTTPATVLDFFSGTGTTAAVANALGRHGVGVELSADYNRLATWRIADPGLRAKVLGVDKPPPQVKGQGSLFDGLAS